ncbi:MAG: DNA translocase FtsK, partial [Sedimentibacter sp.]|nr:DNA translocase FtsK [Sedimentibacter sp.]
AKTNVYLRSLIESREYKTAETNLPFAIGKDIGGKNIIASIDKMPHLLIAGATGSGKSVCINSLIMSILFKARPDEVKLILVDPKVVELSIYNGIPHLLIPVVTDPRKAANALNWAVMEMTNRYKIFAQNGVREIDSYNEKMTKEGKDKMPKIVIIIDELADLMAVASAEVEEYITRIAQLARACGMHLVIATQRPSVDVITGVIKANIPSRIAFAVSSHIDSRTILDTGGAEKLLGKGDMLYYPIGLPKPVRIQGTFISDDEIRRVVDFIKDQQVEIKTSKQNEIIKEIESQTSDDEEDEYLEQAIDMVVNDGQASVSYIQRKFKVGYARAARIIDQLEKRGIVGGHEGSKPRKVLITKEELDQMRGTDE